MNKKDKLLFIYSSLLSLYPFCKCELYYKKDYELAIAVILSAQSTDRSVNKVTEFLFNKYKTLEDFKNADITILAEDIKTIGLYINKAKSIKAFASDLIDRFNSILPKEMESLTSLPGVGNKTARVIRIEIFKINDFPCDTHINRILKRLSIVNKNSSPDEISIYIKEYMDEIYWIKMHHLLIAFGRDICKAKRARCKDCPLINICSFNKKTNS